MEKKLPKGWVETELGNVADIITGNTPSKSNELFYGEDFLWVKPGDFHDNYRIVNTAEKLSNIGFKYARKVAKESVLVTCIGNLGNIAIASRDLATNQQINSIVLNHDFFNKKFMYYSALTFKKWLYNNSTSTTISMVNKSIFQQCPIIVPPLAEQERIANKLDELFARIEVIKKSMDKIPKLLKDFRQQVLTSAVTGNLTEEWREGKELYSYINVVKKNRVEFYNTKKVELKGQRIKKLVHQDFQYYEYDRKNVLPSSWELENIKNICDFITDGEHSTPIREEHGYFLLSARNVQNGYLLLNNVDYVGKEEFDRISKRCCPEYEDILISCSGSVGRVCVFPSDIKAVMVRSVALLKLQSNTKLSKFLEYVLRSDIGQSQIDRLKKSTAQANLFLEPIGKIVVPIPSLAEQEEIVRRVEDLFTKADRIEEQYKVLKEKIDVLPQLLLHKAFKGELVEQLSTDGDAADLLKEIMALKK